MRTAQQFWNGWRLHDLCDLMICSELETSRGELVPIRASVEGYLHQLRGRAVIEDPSRALVDPTELAGILSLTWRLLGTAVEDWLEKHGRHGYASGDVFFRRGLILPELFEDDHASEEPPVLSSYTLSVTLAEQLANTDRKDKKSALVHADFYLMRGRILFFSPFVPGMRSFQLEAGVIPSEKPQRLSFVGVHRGVGEYLPTIRKRFWVGGSERINPAGVS